MKKILSIIASFAVIGSATITVISCGDTKTNNTTPPPSQKLDLTEHLSTNRLGAFEYINPTDEQIFARLQVANPDLKVSEVTIARNKLPNQALNKIGAQDDELDFIPNEATVSVKDDSSIYKEGSQIIYFTDVARPRLGLINVINNTDLGVMNLDYSYETPEINKDDIVKRLEELNPDLEVNQVIPFILKDKEITLPNGNIQGTIGLTLIDDNNYFLGASESYFYLTYEQVNAKRNLSDVLTTTDLGVVSDLDLANNAPELLAIQKNRFVDFSQLITYERNVGNTTGSVTFKVKPDSTVYEQGEITFTYKIDSMKELSQVITQTKLGFFEEEPTDKQILDRIKELNPEIKLDEIYIASNVNNFVVIKQKVNSPFYLYGKVQLYYQVKNIPFLQSIGDAIKTVDLGTLDIKLNNQKGHEQEVLDSEENKTTIINAVKKYNNKVVESELEVTFNRDGYATVKVTDKTMAKIYLPGSVEVHYQNTNLIDLKTIINLDDELNAILGVADDEITVDSKDLYKAIFIHNRQLDLNEITITKYRFVKKEQDALGKNLIITIEANSNSKIYKQNNGIPEESEFKFYVAKKGTFENVGPVQDLGTFDYVPNVEELITEVYNNSRLMNLDVLKNSLMITNRTENSFDAWFHFPGFKSEELITGKLTFSYNLVKE